MDFLTVDMYGNGISTIDNEDMDNERKDVMGDLPDYSTWELKDFVQNNYKRYGRKWYLLEGTLGDGGWKGRNIIKDDALTESIDNLAKREVTMLKLLHQDEVEQLHRLIKMGLDEDKSGNYLENAMNDALEVVYARARKERLHILTENKQVTHQFLQLSRSGYTLNDVYKFALYFTNKVNEQSQDSVNPSQYRKEMRDAFMQELKKRLGVDNIYGRPWAWMNSLYWNCLFGWVHETPNQIIRDCAQRYAYAIMFDEQVNGAQLSDINAL